MKLERLVIGHCWICTDQQFASIVSHHNAVTLLWARQKKDHSEQESKIQLWSDNQDRYIRGNKDTGILIQFHFLSNSRMCYSETVYGWHMTQRQQCEVYDVRCLPHLTAEFQCAFCMAQVAWYRLNAQSPVFGQRPSRNFHNACARARCRGAVRWHQEGG